MSVEFEEYNDTPTRQIQRNIEFGFLTRLVMRISGNRVKNQRDANIVLIGIMLLIITLTIITTFSRKGLHSLPSAKSHEQEELDLLKSYRNKTPPPTHSD